MCENCPAYCCKLVVDLTIYDIARIVLIEERPWEEFLLVKEAGDDDLLAFRAQDMKAKAVLRMKGGRCVFLDTDRDLKCVVEGSKPAICIAYPFVLHEGRPVLRADAKCPIQKKRSADHSKMSKELLEECDWERDRYREMVEDWNVIARGDEPPADFFDFAFRETGHAATPLGSLYRRLRRPLLRFMKRR